MQIIVIIGAGPAGLTAAYELLKSKEQYQVIILEKSSAIGGISKTICTNGNRMDIGGHRFFSKDEHVVAWWNEIMPPQGAPALDDKILNRSYEYSENGVDPTETDNVMLTRTRISHIYYDGKFFDYPISLKWDTLKNMGFFTTIKAGCSYIKASIFKKPEDSLENFYINRFGYVLYSMFFEGYTEKLWGRHPSEISADWGAQRVKGLSVSAIIKDMFSKLPFAKKKSGAEVETSLIEQFSYPKFGPGHLWETVADRITDRGGVIEMNACVKEIICDDNNKITAVIYEQNGKRIKQELDVCISSMPICDLMASLGREAGNHLTEIAKGLPYRDFVTVGLLVPALNLQNKTKYATLNNIIPDCWIYVQEPSVKLGRIQIFNNWSPYMLENPFETVWLGLEYFCEEGDDFWNMDDKECVEFATKELISMGIIDDTTPILHQHRERIQKAYPAYFDTYENMDQIIEFLNQIDNLYCVGRNGQHRYNNMDHSMATAFETVENIKNNRTDKSNIWNVNTDKQYHETKNKE